MIKASPAELQLHFSILGRQAGSFANLNDLYSDHLLGCLNRWYKTYIYPEVSLAHEAVYECLKFYFAHPRMFNPEYGCLKKFLEIAVDRAMQNILAREKYSIPANDINHVLSLHFDNEQDVQLAKLVIQNENDLSAFVHLLDLGSYRIGLQISEIRRQRDRIKKRLDQLSLSLTTIKREYKSLVKENESKEYY